MTQSAFYHQFEPLTKLLKGFAYTLGYITVNRASHINQTVPL